jgi:hypothetical protein
MDAMTNWKRKSFRREGRYSVTVACADDLTADERLILEAWFETEVGLLQKETSLTIEEMNAIQIGHTSC